MGIGTSTGLDGSVLVGLGISKGLRRSWRASAGLDGSQQILASHRVSTGLGGCQHLKESKQVSAGQGRSYQVLVGLGGSRWDLTAP